MNSFQVKESLRLAITTSSIDWSATERHACIYGIINGHPRVISSLEKKEYDV